MVFRNHCCFYLEKPGRPPDFKYSLQDFCSREREIPDTGTEIPVSPDLKRPRKNPEMVKNPQI
jgi:hypothetical protein